MPEETSNSIEGKVLYAELTPSEFRQRLAAAPIAYLPLGTLEWHGEHLPLGSDGLQSQGFFILLAQRVGGIVLPVLFLGPDYHKEVDGREFYGMDIFGFEKGSPQQLEGSAYWVDKDLFKSLLESILGQLARAGFKIVVAHGHGPSTEYFSKNRPEWSKKLDLELFTCWDAARNNSETGLQTDHAAANETSLMMALHPDMVKMDRLSAEMSERPRAIMGKDPRLHASPWAGREIISKNLEWMEEVLGQALQRVTAQPG